MLTMAMHRADAAIDPMPWSQMGKRHGQGSSDESIHGQAGNGSGTWKCLGKGMDIALEMAMFPN